MLLTEGNIGVMQLQKTWLTPEAVGTFSPVLQETHASPAQGKTRNKALEGVPTANRPPSTFPLINPSSLLSFHWFCHFPALLYFFPSGTWLSLPSLLLLFSFSSPLQYFLSYSNKCSTADRFIHL